MENQHLPDSQLPDNPLRSIRPKSSRRTVETLHKCFQASAPAIRLLAAVVLFALAAGCGPTSTPIVWPSMTVNNSGDESDYAPGDGHCQIAANSSVCTLRAAIQESNAFIGHPQTILFDLPANDTTIRPNGTLNYVTDNLILDGTSQPGYDGTTPLVILDGSFSSSGLTVMNGHSLMVKALEIRNSAQIGIESYGMFIVDRSVITGNGEMGIRSHGGGYHTIKDSSIRNNGTQDPSIPTGGLLVKDGTVTITNSLFYGNTGWNSGAIYVEKGEVRLNGCTLQDNIGWDAGGVYVAEGADNLLWIKDGTRIGTPGHGNIAGVISEGTKLGGGIYSEADVILKDSSIEGNAGAGIQIFHQSGLITLDVSGSVIAGNSLQGIDARNTDVTISDSEIRGNDSGGIAMHLGTLSLTRSKVSANENGGGILMEGGHLVMADSTVAENTNFGPGGGVYGHNLSDANIVRSTVSGNSTLVDGGGLYLHTFGQAQILNSTISGNHADAAAGGLLTAGGTFLLTHVTVAGNEAAAVGGILSNGNVTLTNSILAENNPGNCDPSSPPVSGSHNLSDDASCALSGAGDISNQDARLVSLQDNGGPTQTHGLMDDSPAINAAGDAMCPATDQRGIARPIGPHCDMGAFESEFTSSKFNPVTPTRTPISPTDTPTAGPAKGATFDPVEYSANPVFHGGSTCTPNQVTIRVKVSPAEQVKSVGLFYRLEKKDGSGAGAWSEGLAMIPEGGGWYSLTLNADEIPGIRDWHEDAILAVQFIANGAGGEMLARSPVHRELVLSPCTRAG
jgi:hypothetical protein